MKHSIFLSLFLFFTLAGICQRPEGGPPPKAERLQRTMEALNKDIPMTAAQQKGVGSALDDFFTRADKLRETGQRGPEQKAGMDKLVKERDEKVARLLDKDKYATYLATMEKMRPPRRGGENGGPPRQGGRR